MVRVNTTNWDNFVRTFPQIEREFIGFNKVFDAITASNPGVQSSYPPYNVKKVDEENYLIELAVSGFKKDEITIRKEADNKNALLIVEGSQAEKEDDDYIHKGIGGRNFKRAWNLADTIEVSSAVYVDGILSIALVNVIPESQKPQVIEIK
jgi:molecular chaperone IbpA